tara:strand:- start:3469 stop:4671 length:1203 start_codon:yes stop_codon:yes gene_type:complete
MHVFIVTQYFPPELGASASRWGDYTDILLKQNHKVTILCETPHYPNKNYFNGFKNAWSTVEKISPNFTVIRSKAYASNRKTFLKKIAHYTVFMISACFNFRKVKNYDLLIISSPPLFTGVIGVFGRLFFKAEYWLDVRDLWPESALELKQINKGLLYKLGKKLESKIYHMAKGFIFPVPVFRKYLDSYSNEILKKPKIELINGVSEDFINLAKSKKLYSSKKFTVLYSGNMGLAQDLSTLVKASEVLKDHNIQFIFIGDGVCREEIEILANRLNNKNIKFYDSMKRKDLISWIIKSSLCIVPLKNKKIFQSAIPSKMFEYMACERPIVVGVKGEAKKIIEQVKAGIAIEPEDPLALSEAILKYYNNRHKCKIDGKNGMIYVTNNLSKEVLISNLINEIKK